MRDNWTCCRCGRYEYKGLQNSHYFGRTKKSVRFDEENCDALCYGCHRFWEKEDREAYREFKINQLGEEGFYKLQSRANTPQKQDEKLIAKYYAEKVRQLEKQMF